MIKEYYTNGHWLRNPKDPPEDYDLAIFICNKSEADILKNKVSDSIIKNISDSAIKNINTITKYDDYQYISLNIFNSYYFYTLTNKLLNRIVLNRIVSHLDFTSLMTQKMINIAIVIFEKEFYVFADDKLIDWINRVVDIFKKEKKVSRSIFVYNVIFGLMSELNLMLKDLYKVIYHYSKQSRTILFGYWSKILQLKHQEKLEHIISKTSKPKDISKPTDEEIETNLIKNLIEIKDLVLELRLYLTSMKEVLREIQPLFRETSECYNKLFDIKEEFDDELYKIEQNMQNVISTTFLLVNLRKIEATLRKTEATKRLTAISAILIILSTFSLGSEIIYRAALILLLLLIAHLVERY